MKKIWFPTVKVAENLHTASPRYPNGFGRFKCLGIGPFPKLDKEFTKQVLGVDAFLRNGEVFAFRLTFLLLPGLTIRAKRVKTRQKIVPPALALLLNCLQLKMGSERPVHMCGFGPKSIHGDDFLLNQEGRRAVDAGNGLHHRPLHAKNGGDELTMLPCPVSRRPDGPGHPEVEKTPKNAHGSSWK